MVMWFTTTGSKEALKNVANTPCVVVSSIRAAKMNTIKVWSCRMTNDHRGLIGAQLAENGCQEIFLISDHIFLTFL